MVIRWRLKEFLDERGISTYQLAKEVEGLTPVSVYRNARDVAALRLDTLDAFIKALRSLTGKEVTVCDLLEYEPAERGPGAPTR